MVGGSSRNVQKPWHDGSHCNVYWDESFEKTFKKKGEPNDRAKIEASMKRRYAEHGPANIPPTHFTSERAISVGGRKVQVWVFKSFQLRVYGVQGSVNGKRSFFAVEVDPKKKQNKADPKILERAAKKGVSFLETIPGAKV